MEKCIAGKVLRQGAMITLLFKVNSIALVIGSVLATAYIENSPIILFITKDTRMFEIVKADFMVWFERGL